MPPVFMRSTSVMWSPLGFPMSSPLTVSLVMSLCVSIRRHERCTRATSSSPTVRFCRPGACAYASVAASARGTRDLAGIGTEDRVYHSVAEAFLPVLLVDSGVALYNSAPHLRGVGHIRLPSAPVLSPADVSVYR